MRVSSTQIMTSSRSSSYCEIFWRKELENQGWSPRPASPRPAEKQAAPPCPAKHHSCSSPPRGNRLPHKIPLLPRPAPWKWSKLRDVLSKFPIANFPLSNILIGFLNIIFSTSYYTVMFKSRFPFANDLNQLIYSHFAPPRPRDFDPCPTPTRRF